MEGLDDAGGDEDDDARREVEDEDGEVDPEQEDHGSAALLAHRGDHDGGDKRSAEHLAEPVLRLDGLVLPLELPRGGGDVTVDPRRGFHAPELALLAQQRQRQVRQGGGRIAHTVGKLLAPHGLTNESRSSSSLLLL